MSTNKASRNIIHAVQDISHRVIHYISSAVIRIFSPQDDNYPATGVQPYDGDPANDKDF